MKLPRSFALMAMVVALLLGVGCHDGGDGRNLLDTNTILAGPGDAGPGDGPDDGADNPPDDDGGDHPDDEDSDESDDAPIV